MNSNDELRDALRRRADRLGDDQPFTLSDVQGHARHIRRRRLAVSGLAAAAVLAIAAPIGLILADGPGSSRSVDPANPSPTPSPSQTVEPKVKDGAPRGTTYLKGDVPGSTVPVGIPYLEEDEIVTADGRIGLSGKRYQDIEPFGERWLATRANPVDGYTTLDLIEPDGSIVTSWDRSGYPALSADGTLAAFSRADGSIQTLQVGEEAALEIKVPEKGNDGIGVLAIRGSDTCQEGENGSAGCTVWFTTDQGSEYISSHGNGDTTGPVLSATTVSDAGEVGGFIDSSGLVDDPDFESCSAVLEPDSWKQQWRTCDYSLGAFSPDGRYLIGKPAYLDGIGFGSVAILDAATGKPVWEFTGDKADYDAGRNVYFTDVAWDTDGSLLGTLYYDDAWHLVRMFDNGRIEDALGGAVSGGGYDDIPIYLSGSR